MDTHKNESIRDICIRASSMPHSKKRNALVRKLFHSMGIGCTVRVPLMVDAQNVSMGDNCFINHNFTVLGFSPVVLGNNVGISSGVTLIAIKHPHNPLNGEWVDLPGPIEIEDGAWIGANATIFPNVTIGEGAKVGAGSVVVKDVPPRATVFGNPARVIKTDKGENVQLDERYTAPTTQRGC